MERIIQMFARVYARLKKIAPEVDSLNIGGGFPIKTSLTFEYDYAYMVDEIVYRIKQFCEEEGVEEPNIYTEFGSFTCRRKRWRSV